MNFNDKLDFVKRRNFKKADWVNYKHDLQKSFCNFDTNFCTVTDIQTSYNHLIDQMNSSADKNIPNLKICTNPTKKFKPKEYWTPLLSKLVAERRLTLKHFRRNPTPENLKLFEDKVTEVRKQLQQAKHASWKSFCSNINECTNVSEMWNKMRWYKGYRAKRSSIPHDKKKELLFSLTPDFVANCPPVIESNNELLQIPFTMQELRICLKKKDTSPGSDGITYSMVSHLPSNGIEFLLNIYNTIYRLGILPKQWRTILIVPIPKRESSSNSETIIRPISLISCLCKIFHNMIGKRLEWFIEKHQILSPMTCGFRRAQSCLDSLTRLVSYIQISFANNSSTVACFLDLENAYNNVSVDKVISTLDHLGVGKNICAYLWSFLSNRNLKIKCEENDEMHDIIRSTNRGLAQGDPISPLLFNIVTHNICRSINNVQVSQYADDYVFYLSHNNLNYCETKLQDAINNMINFLDKIGLSLSANKSKVMIFSRGRKIRQLSIKINNNELLIVDTFKYLGLWLDRSLRWSKHVNETLEKAMKFINLIRVLVGPGWGLHPKHVRTLFISLIRSRLDYACFLYNNSAKTHLTKLDRLQNQALRIIGGYIKSTPIHVMECELYIPPLFVRRLYLAYKFCIKSLSWSNNNTTKLLNELSSPSYDRYWQRVKKPLLMSIFNECQNCNIHNSNPIEMFKLNVWVNYVKIYNIIFTDLDCIKEAKRYQHCSVKIEIIRELNEKYPRWIKIFTDGSKTASGLGASYYDPQKSVFGVYKIETKIHVL